MGLNNNSGTGKYLTILGGKICQRVPEGTEGAVERTNKMGKVVNERFFDNLTALLTNITFEESPYGKQTKFQFKDNEDTYYLTMGYSSPFTVAFLKMLPNINLSLPIKISPSTKEQDGKQVSSLFINQNNTPIKHAFTKDNPNNLPAFEEILVKGVKVWDSTKRLQFLENLVNTEILPKLHAMYPNTQTTSNTSLGGDLSEFDTITSDQDPANADPF